MRFMHENNVDHSVLRSISMASYHHAQNNPRAVMYNRPLSAEKYDDEEYIDPTTNIRVKTPFRDDPNDQGDAHANLRKGYSKVLANRLGTKGVEDLHVYFENCHFIKYVKEHKDNKYLKECLEQMRSTM